MTIMTPTPVVSKADADALRLFSTPGFEVKIANAGLPEGVLRDISEITYRDSLTELDQFEFTVNNWGPGDKSPNQPRRLFKYIGSESAKDLKEGDPIFRVFEPCAKLVTLSMGYLNHMKVMMTGTFTTMEPSFGGGASTLTVRGLNALHKLRTKKFSNAWENKTPSEIAKDLASKSDKGKKRFAPELRIIKENEGPEAKIPYVAQSSQYDVDFLLNLARQHGYDIQLVREGIGAQAKDVVIFGLMKDAHFPVNYALDWGRTLIDFKPTLTTSNQFKSVTVRGWDRKTQKPIEEKVNFDDPKMKKMNAKFKELITECDPKEEQVVDLPVFSKADARKRAEAMMRDNSARIIRASGTTIGLPELRAGTRLKIGELGARLSGEYLVTKTTHTIGESGYTTKFECRLEDFSGVER
jgi:uncharacterized protein